MTPKHRSPIHPGEVLHEEFLAPLGISDKQLVSHLGGKWTLVMLTSLIKGRRRLSASLALDLGDAFNTSAEFWLNLQKKNDLWRAKQGRQPIAPF